MNLILLFLIALPVQAETSIKRAPAILLAGLQFLLASPAATIAEAARAWGQTDDITVVTVRRTNS